MALQFQNFTPNDQKHYTLAETQSEKDATLQRAMAQDAANNAARSADHAMSIDSSNQQHAMSLAQNAKQAGVENGLNQQRINSDNTRVGLANAREMEKTRADVAQNDIANKRQAFADQNTLQQQGLTNARQNISDKQTTEKFNLEKEALLQKKSLADKHLAIGELGLTLATSKSDENGEIDITNHRNILTSLGLTDELTKHESVMARIVDGKTELYGIDKDGNHSVIMHNKAPVKITNDALSIFSDFYAKQLGVKEDGDFEVNYQQTLGPDGMTLVKTPVSIINKKNGNLTNYPGASGQPSNELAALNATKETNKNTDAPVVNSDKVNALTGQTPVVQADNSGGLSAARNNDAIDGRDNMFKTVNNGVTTFSNKPPPSAPAPAQGLAGQGPAKTVQAKQTAPSQLPLGDQLINLGEKVTQGDRDSINNAPQAQKAEIAQGIISRISRLGY